MTLLDYPALRAAISMKQVLTLLQFQPSQHQGPQLRGPCPIHDPYGEDDPRCLSVHLTRGVFRCFRCAAHGNQLDLWRLTQRVPIYEAAIELCRQARLTPPTLPSSLPDSRNSQAPSALPATD